MPELLDQLLCESTVYFRVRVPSGGGRSFLLSPVCSDARPVVVCISIRDEHLCDPPEGQELG